MKSKQIIMGAFALASVLGTVSCNRESIPKSESLRVPPPSFIRQTTPSQAIEFTAWSNTKVLDLSIADEIRWPQPLTDISMVVDATCQTESGLNARTRTQWAEVQSLNILQLVPPAIWRLDSGERPTCRLDFLARNSRGARHLFHLPDLKLQLGDSGFHSRTKINGQEVTNLNEHRLSATEESHLRLWFDSKEELWLICEKVQARLNTTNQGFVEMDEIDWPTASASRSREQCRVMAGTIESPKALSPRFIIDLPPYEFSIAYSRLGLASTQTSILGQALIQNNSNSTIYLKLNSVPAEQVDGYFIGTSTLGHRTQGLEFALINSSSDVLKLAGDVLAVPARATFSVQISLNPRGACRGHQPQSGWQEAVFYAVARQNIGLQILEPSAQGSSWLDAGKLVLLKKGETLKSEPASEEMRKTLWSQIQDELKRAKSLTPYECRTN